MTDKQILRVKTRIEKYKKALAADKKHWGGYYHDGRGIRYLLPQFYIQIEDYKGGLRYLNWFNKNFPDDSGYPVFLFECAFILFKSDKLVDAEKKVYSTFFSNTYLFDKFFGKESLQLDKYENSNWEFESLLNGFQYSHKDPAFTDFAGWIAGILSTGKFLDTFNDFVEITRLLQDEPVGTTRSKLVNRLSKILYG